MGLILILVLCSSTYYYFTHIDFSDKKIIKLSSWNLINESGCGNSLALIDEFSLNDSFVPKTFWEPNHHDVCKDKKLSEIIDFDTLAEIKQVYFYSNTWGIINYSYSSNLDALKSFNLSFGWNKLELNSVLKQFKFEVVGDLKIGEIVIEGSYVGNYKLKPLILNYPTISEFLGVNAFVDDPIGASSIVNHVREYHESVWHQNSETSFNFNPSFPGFDFETYYQNFSSSEKSVVPVIQHSGKWLTGQEKGENIPIKQGADYLNPNSYKYHSELMFRFTQNYKSKNLNLKFIENWNEPDKYWEGNKTYMPPYYYAAMSSMDYDGHRDTSKYSITKGDVSCKLVLAGLIDVKSDYINALKFWCDKNRNGHFPWDVVNAHLYANDEKLKVGITPEKFNFKQKVQDFVINTKRNLPNTKVWLTEYGYDKKADSPQRVPEIDGYTAEQIQAIWLLRSTLLLSSTGLDRAYQYMLRDTKGTGLYASSGLYGLKNNSINYYESWYYLKNLVETLGSYKFVKTLPTKNADVYILMFQDNNFNKAFALWVGDDARKTYENYSVDLGGVKSSTLFKLNFEKSATVNTQKLNYSKNFKINISEKPFLLFEKQPVVKNHKRVLASELIVDDITNRSLIDEQHNYDPLFYPEKSEFTSLNNNKVNTVKFTNSKFISYLSMYDDEGQSLVNIFKLKNGIKEPVYQSNLLLYKKWKSIYIGDNCEGIVLEHVNHTSKIGEVVIYEYK